MADDIVIDALNAIRARLESDTSAEENALVVRGCRVVCVAARTQRSAEARESRSIYHADRMGITKLRSFFLSMEGQSAGARLYIDYGGYICWNEEGHKTNEKLESTWAGGGASFGNSKRTPNAFSRWSLRPACSLVTEEKLSHGTRRASRPSKCLLLASAKKFLTDMLCWDASIKPTVAFDPRCLFSAVPLLNVRFLSRAVYISSSSGKRTRDIVSVARYDDQKSVGVNNISDVSYLLFITKLFFYKRTLPHLGQRFVKNLSVEITVRHRNDSREVDTRVRQFLDDGISLHRKI